MWVLSVPLEPSAILSAHHVIAAHQFEGEPLVKCWDRLEVEAIQTLRRREPGRPYPPFDHAAFALNEFQFGEPQQIARIVDAILGTQTGELVVLGEEGRQLQLFEVMAEQRLGIDRLRGAHAANSRVRMV